jgi:hypothetical protein
MADTHSDRRLMPVITAIPAAILAIACLMAGCAPPEPAELDGTTAPTTTSPPTSPASQTSRPMSPSEQAATADDPLDGYSPLWPFSTTAEVAQWQDAGRNDTQWHLDAETTALFFTANYLGFTDINQVVSSDIGPREAKVTVGYRADLAQPAPAAVVHLFRYGDGEQAPWEVVGTIDSTFSVTAPAPGTPVTSPVRVAGRITGVDESIHVQVREPTLPQPIGDACCLAAGGENTPWTTSVKIQGASKATLTIVAATGGHAADVERFAVTGVRLAG